MCMWVPRLDRREAMLDIKSHDNGRSTWSHFHQLIL
jgi:hypothetical protein